MRQTGEVGLHTAGKVILVVSFGTSYAETREATIGAIEKAVAHSFPDYEVRRAFTSQIIINKLKKRDGEQIDNVEEAMERLVADGVQMVIIQPTHVMNGYEYDDMMEAVAPYETHFASIRYGKPLLGDEEDYEAMVKILAEETAGYDDGKTAIVYMGHGTEHAANFAYGKLADCLKHRGYCNHYIGTVEAKPDLNDVMEQVNRGKYEKVVLFPLMIVAGDHAVNDMAGDEEDSWKTTFLSKGYQVKCVLKGMGQYPAVRRMFVDHVRQAE